MNSTKIRLFIGILFFALSGGLTSTRAGAFAITPATTPTTTPTIMAPPGVPGFPGLPGLPTFVKPKFKVGDWNSSGDHKPPYNPSYPYAYACQIQITDQLLRSDANSDGRDYHLYAIADVTFANDVKRVETSGLKWTAIKFYGIDRIEDSDEPLPFATHGHSVSLYVDRNGSGKEDTVGLALYLQQEINGLIVANWERPQYPRSKKRFEHSVRLDIRDANNRPVPQLLMRVLCDKNL